MNSEKYTVIKRNLPKNLIEKDKKLFQKENEKIVYEPRIIKINKININSDGILFKFCFPLVASFSGGTVYSLSFIKNKEILWKHYFKNKKLFLRNILFLKNYLLDDKKTLYNKYVYFIDNWSTGYFHWFADALPRLYIARNNTNKNIILPKKYKNIEYIRESLKIFNLKKIIYVKSDKSYRLKNLIIPVHLANSGNYNEKIISDFSEYIKNFFRKNNLFNKDDSFSDRIFISRKNAKKRWIVNEAELYPILKKYKFNILKLEDYKWNDQVNICMHAKYMISNHGAGLVNMLFMKNNGAILELRKEKDCSANCYYSLASALNIKYFYQLCNIEKTKSRKENDYNIIVDKNKLEETIKNMLNLK